MQRLTPTNIIVLGCIILLAVYWYFPGALDNPRSLLNRVAAILIAITFHEFSHAAAAFALGDNTARSMGRLSLNPIRHLDPIGTILMFVGPIGWGKPVPVNPWNMRISPGLGSALVSLAGPASNVLLAMLVVAAFRVLGPLDVLDPEFARALLVVNIGLAAFNLLPVPPLDGFGIVYGLLPRSLASLLQPLATYGPVILMVLVVMPSFGAPRVLDWMMAPIMSAIAQIVVGR
jgi:Zn-dependent protease